MMRFAFPLFVLVVALGGCASQKFELTDSSAMAKVMATQHFADLQRANPTTLMCMVEGSTPDEIDVYVGEDHPDHTVRVATCRVTRDGQVWVNSDPTLLTEAWVVVR